MVKITHKGGNASHDNLTGYAHDDYSIKHGGQEIAVLRIEYADDETAVSVTGADSLPGFAGAAHVIATAMVMLLQGFSEDHSFYFEQFYDEDGNKIEKDFLPLTI